MSKERIVVDGLWRCLCPSIDASVVLRLVSRPGIPRPRPRPTIPPTRKIPPSTQTTCRRGFGEVATGRDPEQFGTEQGPSIKRYAVEGSPNKQEEYHRSRVQYLQRLAKRTPWVPDALFNETDSFIRRLERIPTQTIYAALRALHDVDDTYHAVVKMVEYLVVHRAQKPDTTLYECLIRANVDRKHGSAKVANSLFSEMKRLGIPTTPKIYQSLLEVTSVHPDYILRSTVLFEMKTRWYTSTADDQVSIVVGLLRDTQYELALEKLEEMNRTEGKVPSWLYDICLYVYGGLGFHEETLALFKHRLHVAQLTSNEVTLNEWHFLLDVFSRDGYYPGVKYIWERPVKLGSLNPSDGVATNILNTAARHGDPALALSVIQLLSKRQKKLDLHHYEPLIEVHAQRNELRKAFVVLCVMAKAGLKPDLSSTRAIYQKLRQSSEATDGALQILDELRKEYKVPSAAFNVVLEAVGHHRGIKVALDLYRSVRQICADGPDLETFHVLLRYCTQRKSLNFLHAEMRAFPVDPTPETYDHLIRVAAMQDNYAQAFDFLGAMRAKRDAGLAGTWWVTRDTALALARRCVHAGDGRVRALVEECARLGFPIDAEVKMLVEDVQRLRERVGDGRDGGDDKVYPTLVDRPASESG
ncbi:hypothetical protein F4778DRAFT_613933 [Xylariomycetidae sp. FL2044]|nr:hypothetical protein F4778DRAFT_613933 [Xylariomycetidae sp. FL2044]